MFFQFKNLTLFPPVTNFLSALSSAYVTCKVAYSYYSLCKMATPKRPKIGFKTNYRLIQVKSIAECSKGSILQYFRPSLSYHLSLRSLFCLFLVAVIHRFYCIANNMDPEQTSDKIWSEVHLNIYSRLKKQMTFSEQKCWWDKG